MPPFVTLPIEFVALTPLIENVGLNFFSGGDFKEFPEFGGEAKYFDFPPRLALAGISAACFETACLLFCISFTRKL